MYFVKTIEFDPPLILLSEVLIHTPRNKSTNLDVSLLLAAVVPSKAHVPFIMYLTWKHEHGLPLQNGLRCIIRLSGPLKTRLVSQLIGGSTHAPSQVKDAN